MTAYVRLKRSNAWDLEWPHCSGTAREARRGIDSRRLANFSSPSEPEAGHRAPALLAAEVLPVALQAPDIADLALAEILDNRDKGQHNQREGPRERPQLDLLHDKRSDTDEDSKDEGQRQEGKHVLY